MPKTVRTHIVSITELNCSVNANPRFDLFTTDMPEPYRTSSDTAASYEARNAVGKDVTLTLTRRGRVTNIAIEKFMIEDYEVCTVCAHIIANGEFDDGTNARELAISGTLLRHPEGYTGMHLDADPEIGFRTTMCDTCGENLHGDRFKAVRLTEQ